jgi:tRNA1(Val) A37 N6-methylase TrmN6
MEIKYEGIKLEIDIHDEYQCVFLKIFFKSIFKKVFKIRIKMDDYLEYAYKKLVDIKHPIVVDVGCNFGTTALPVEKKFGNSSIFAIEPHPIAASRFVENVRLNSLSNINLIVAAVTSDEGMCRI